MQQKLEKKYGLFTAICMVVGIVIGSGVFFKAQTILMKTGGNISLGILAWVIGGAIMIVNVLAFAVMAQKYALVNGLVDYAEAMVGKPYAYAVGWFMSSIYTPTLTSVLAWLSARYTLVFLTSVNPNLPLMISAAEGGCVIGPECMVLTLLYLCLAYALNALSPKLAGKFLTTTTVIKLIPLGLMAVAGIVYGLANGMLSANFSYTAQATAIAGGENQLNLLLSAVCATAFAYEGWIIATSINAELKDAKRNLPIALVLGGIIIMGVYIAYYVGVAGGASVTELMETGATRAFTNIFGGVLGNILNLFIAISCLGTTNGLMLACTRGLYALAARGEGPAHETLSQVDRRTNMPHNAAIAGLMFSALWFVYFYLAQLSAAPSHWLGSFVFDSSEISIITLYALYIPIFVQWMRKQRDENILRRYVIPSLAILGALFMVYACIVGHGMGNVYYLIVFAFIMAIGMWFRRAKPNLNSSSTRSNPD